ncbi:MAG: dockerin type I domain-containing protein [Halobacteriota archaeon]|nr:dockerin type I domain-containing protein [Halobacteriota archaeon]
MKLKSSKVLAVGFVLLLIISMFGGVVPVGAVYDVDDNLITTNATNTVIRGQTLKFTGNDVGKNIVGKAPSAVDGVVIGTATSSFDSNLFPQPGTYYIDITGEGNYSSPETLLSVADPQLILKIKISGTEVSTVTRGANATLDIRTNLNTTHDCVTLVVKDSNGNLIPIDGNGNDLTKVNVSFLEANGLNTTGWDIDTYEIWLETIPSKAQGLDLSTESVKKTLKVVPAKLTVSVSKDTVTENEYTALTVKGPANHDIILRSNKANAQIVTGYYEQTGASNEPIPTDWSMTPAKNLGADYTYNAVLMFTEEGTYKIYVNDTTNPTVSNEDVTIKVTEAVITLDVPGTADVGQKVDIKGTTDAPDGVDQILIAVEDRYGTYLLDDGDTVIVGSTTVTGKDVDVDDGEFEFELNTVDVNGDGLTSMRAGSYKISAYLVSDTSLKDFASIVLKSETIEVNVVNPVISTHDKIMVEGTTTGGPDEVRMILEGKNISAVKNLTVTDDRFEKEMEASDWNSWWTPEGMTATPYTYTTGSYNLYVIHPMGDGVFEMDINPHLGGLASCMQQIAAKGFDDYYVTSTMYSDEDEIVAGPVEITIAYPSLKIDTISDVVQGDELVISGTVNRADGTYFNVNVIGPGVDEIETIEAADGAISATFDTTGWALGSYLVTVEDIDGLTSAQAEFNVVMGIPNINIDVEVDPASVDVGDTTMVTVYAKNDGNAEGTVSVSLKIDGVEWKSVELTVAAGETEMFEAEYEATMPGTFTFTADGASATLTVKTSKATISIPDVMSKETVTVPITIKNVSDVGACQLSLTYDPEVVIVSEVVNSDFDSIFANLENASSGSVGIIAYQVENSGLNGDVILSNLNFTVVGDIGTSTPLSLDVITLTDATPDSNPIPHFIMDGIFEVFLNGDVNGDDSVNSGDCMYLAKHLLGIAGFETIVEPASDVNGNGVVEASDCMYLAKHLNGVNGFEALI